MGKIRPEGEGEAPGNDRHLRLRHGTSRQLYGLTMHSERLGHRMYEQWHPLGVVGVISAFNFPVAVWSWNAAIAAVCGDTTLWKPSSQTPRAPSRAPKSPRKFAAKPAWTRPFQPGHRQGQHRRRTAAARSPDPAGLRHRKLPHGLPRRRVVGKRLGRTILELGGNNAIIVTPESDIKLAVRAIVFGAVGTAGQRCTSTRRIIVHESIRDQLVEKLIAAYQQVPIGNPLEPSTLMGPLVDAGAVETMMKAVARIKEEGGKILYGGQNLDGDKHPGGCYVTPCIAAARNELKIVQEETFAPILYVLTYKTLNEAIDMQNGVPQGLSSSIFTRNLLEAERFLSTAGSDCGIANVNIGTSGAEIGGAFGGERETGGGRESGSDAWKAYMRRQTNTINYTTELPLAQGIRFGD